MIALLVMKFLTKGAVLKNISLKYSAFTLDHAENFQQSSSNHASL